MRCSEKKLFIKSYNYILKKSCNHITLIYESLVNEHNKNKKYKSNARNNYFEQEMK